MDGAQDVDRDSNAVEGAFFVRVKDAFAEWAPSRYFALRAGPFQAPATAEAYRSTSDLLFIDRALGEEGVLVARGLESPGLGIDREIGLALGMEDPFRVGNSDVQVEYALMVANGNGPNQLRNDNQEMAVFGRLGVGYDDVVRAGVAFARNPRTEGTLPNLFSETDTSIAVDAGVTIEGVEAYGEYVTVSSEQETFDGPSRDRKAWHAQLGYTLPIDAVEITPAYRAAYFDPYASSTGVLGASELTYHTAGVRVQREFSALRVGAHLEYTIATEADTRAIDNDTFQAMVFAVFKARR